ICFPTLTLHHPARMTSARGVACTRHRHAEFAIRVLRIFLERAVLEPLLIAQLHPAEIEYSVLHRALDALAAARLFPLKQRRKNSCHQMNPGTGIADLGAGD